MPSSPAIARISTILRGDLDSTPDTSCFTSPVTEREKNIMEEKERKIFITGVDRGDVVVVLGVLQ